MHPRILTDGLAGAARPARGVGLALCAALALMLTLPAASTARQCSGFSLPAFYVADFKVAAVSCNRARTLLANATLTGNRRGRTTWRYAGWVWHTTRIDETTNRIRGTRRSARIAAVWSA